MTAIVSWCLRRRSVVVLASILILGVGAFGATQLRQQYFPDVDFPFVVTNVPVTGLDAEGVDEQVAQPLEAAATNLEDVETTQTVSNDGRATLVTELAYGTDTKQFEEDLARELSSVQLPAGVGELDIGGGFDEQAVLNAAMSAEGDLVTLTEQAEDVQDDLEDIPGVGRVDLDGGVDEEYAVYLKRRAVRRGETPATLAAKIQAALREAPVGLVERDGSQTPLLIDPGTVDDLEELERLPISSRRELADVATIRRQNAEGTGFARTNGKPSIALSVFTEDDANQVQVVDESEAVLARAQEEIGGVEVSTIFETASDVKASVNGLLLEGTLGALFAVVVIFFFLRSVRPTLVAAVAIPTSLVFGLLAAWMLGLTLNIITLAGLTIAIGRVIDDAIVVLENIYKHLERGEPRMQAALEGTSEVANAIVSSTIATAAVFLPLGLVGGLISEIFFSFSIIVVVALLASLLVAVTLIPVLGATFMRPRARPKEDGGALARIVTPVTRFGIRPVGRIVVIAAAFAALIGTIAVVAGGGIPVQFLPDSGTQQAFGTVNLPPGVGAERAERLLQPLEDELNGIDGVESAQVTFGGAGVQTDEVEDTENGSFFANFKEGVDVNRVTADLQRFGDEEYPRGFTADRLEQGPPAGEFEATVVGDDQEDAERAAKRITKLLDKRKDITQVENEAADEQTEFVLEVDEDERGTEDQERATQALAAMVASGDAGTVGDDDLPVVVRAPKSLLDDAEALEDVPLPPSQSDQAALAARAGGGGGAPAGGAPSGGGTPPAGGGASGGAPAGGGGAPGGGAPAGGPAAPGGAPPAGAGGGPPAAGGAPASGSPPAAGSGAAPPAGGSGADSRSSRQGKAGAGGKSDPARAQGAQAPPRVPGKPGAGGKPGSEPGAAGGSGARGGAPTAGVPPPGAAGAGGAPPGGDPAAAAAAAAAQAAAAQAGAAAQAAGGAAGAAGQAAGAAGQAAAGAGQAAAGVAAQAAALAAAGAPQAPARPRIDTVGDVGVVKRQKAAGSLSRVDSEPAVRVSARILGEDVNAINQEIQAEVGELGLVNARVEIGGDQEFINQMFTDLGTAILAAVVLVFLVLVVFFGSTSQPVTILAPVLFSSIGSLLALVITDAALGLPAMIGQLLLIGIVVANSILLVDTALRNRRAGIPRDEALVSAARLRVRPVLMTALATIAALLPLAAGFSGEGGIISQSLGAVVIGGLLTATLLTLVIVPAVFSTFDGLGHAIGRLFGRHRAESALAGATTSSATGGSPHYEGHSDTGEHPAAGLDAYGDAEDGHDDGRGDAQYFDEEYDVPRAPNDQSAGENGRNGGGLLARLRRRSGR